MSVPLDRIVHHWLCGLAFVIKWVALVAYWTALIAVGAALCWTVYINYAKDPSAFWAGAVIAACGLVAICSVLAVIVWAFIYSERC